MLKTSLEIVAPELAARPLMSAYLPGKTIAEENELCHYDESTELSDPRGPMRDSAIVTLKYMGVCGESMFQLVSVFNYAKWLQEYLEVDQGKLLPEQDNYAFTWIWEEFTGSWNWGWRTYQEATELGVLPGDILTFRVFEPVWSGGEDGEYEHQVELLEHKHGVKTPNGRKTLAIRTSERFLEGSAIENRDKAVRKRFVWNRRDWWKVRIGYYGHGLGMPNIFATLNCVFPRHSSRWGWGSELNRVDIMRAGGDYAKNRADILAKLREAVCKQIPFFLPEEFDRLPVEVR